MAETRPDDSPTPPKDAGPPADASDVYELVDVEEDPHPTPLPPGLEVPSTPTPAEPSPAADGEEGGFACPHCQADLPRYIAEVDDAVCPRCHQPVHGPLDEEGTHSRTALASLVTGVASVILSVFGYALFTPILGSALAAMLGGLAVFLSRRTDAAIAAGRIHPSHHGTARLGHITGAVGLVLGCLLTTALALIALLQYATGL